jgi:hypothetical protein
MTDRTQLGFADLLTLADAANRQRRFERETAHLPATMEDALPFHRLQIRQHHAAMLAGDIDAAMRIRKEAHRLAVRLNGGNGGILAGDEAPGCVLDRRSAAASGAVPLWGQRGDFTITVAAMPVRIEMDGMFGIGATFCPLPGFAARAVDRDRPFISETGFRSFLGLHAELVPGLTPDSFAHEVIAAHIRCELKGRLRRIGDEYR